MGVKISVNALMSFMSVVVALAVVGAVTSVVIRVVGAVVDSGHGDWYHRRSRHRGHVL